MNPTIMRSGAFARRLTTKIHAPTDQREAPGAIRLTALGRRQPATAAPARRFIAMPDRIRPGQHVIPLTADKAYHTRVPCRINGLRRSSTPSPNATIRSTGARPRGSPAGNTSIRRQLYGLMQHRRTRLPSTQAVARHRNPLRQIRPDSTGPAGLRRHPRPSGNS